MSVLTVAVAVAMGWAVVGLAAAAMRAWRRGTAPVVAAPAGSPWPGLLYVFSAGMSPRAKESASQHPLVYAAGLAYHVGVAAGGLVLALTLAGAQLSRPIITLVATLLLVGLAAGTMLLVRRARTPLLRAISAGDDYVANLLVDAWLGTAVLVLLVPAASAPFLLTTVALAVYVPLGKIRHCVFFFLSRGLYGARLGRRGLVGSRTERVPS